MSRRRRSIVLAGLALLCGLGSAAIASRYQGQVEAGYGETRSVVVVERPLQRGTELSPRELERSLGSAEIPLRFLAPDALSTPEQALGGELAVDLPAGSYLLASQLRTVAPAGAAQPKLDPGLRPIEIEVSAAATLSTPGSARPGRRVDVIVASEAGFKGEPKVEAVARSVPLLGLRRAGADQETGEPAWLATLGLSREQALEVIEAENFAREVRLLAR